MEYKTILLNTDTYNKVSIAKKKLSERLEQKLSFGDLFNETFGKNIDFIDIDDALKGYIKNFCEQLEEGRYAIGALLFGSVARQGYNKYSDIDVLVVVQDRRDALKVMEQIHAIKRGLLESGRSLVSKQLPIFISPIVLEKKELGKFRPIYLDFLDYGIVLFEKRGILTRFLGEMRKIKHSREFRPYEVLRWQT